MGGHLHWNKCTSVSELGQQCIPMNPLHNLQVHTHTIQNAEHEYILLVNISIVIHVWVSLYAGTLLRNNCMVLKYLISYIEQKCQVQTGQLKSVNGVLLDITLVSIEKEFHTTVGSWITWNCILARMWSLTLTSNARKWSARGYNPGFFGPAF